MSNIRPEDLVVSLQYIFLILLCRTDWHTGFTADKQAKGKYSTLGGTLERLKHLCKQTYIFKIPASHINLVAYLMFGKCVCVFSPTCDQCTQDHLLRLCWYIKGHRWMWWVVVEVEQTCFSSRVFLALKVSTVQYLRETVCSTNMHRQQRSRKELSIGSTGQLESPNFRTTFYPVMCWRFDWASHFLITNFLGKKDHPWSSTRSWHGSSKVSLQRPNIFWWLVATEKSLLTVFPPWASLPQRHLTDCQ